MNAIKEIELDKLIPTPENPRNITKKADDDLKALAKSIGARGVFHPVIARPHPEKKGFFDLRHSEAKPAAPPPLPGFTEYSHKKAIELWQEILEKAKDQVDSENYKTWLEPIEPIGVDELSGDTFQLILVAKSNFHESWFVRNFLEAMLSFSDEVKYISVRVNPEQDDDWDEETTQKMNPRPSESIFG